MNSPISEPFAAANDEAWMRLAIAQAHIGEGGTRPNPPVGAILVRDGVCLATGHHSRAGENHAETDALRKLPPGTAKGATLYVTLEPCSTAGRVGACTDAIFAAGISRVVAAVEDLNPKHAGRGFAKLRAGGVSVRENVLREEALPLVEPFFKQLRTGLPWVQLKMAQTLDGGISDHAGVSRWITGEAARAEVARMRAAADVVLVGAGTILSDHPSLLRKGEKDGFTGIPGLRCFLDARGRVPATESVFTDGHAAQTYVATSALCPEERILQWRSAGAKVEVFPCVNPGAAVPKLDLEQVLRWLASETGALKVLCEGGSALAGELLNAGLVDELALFIAPKILGAGHLPVFGSVPFDLPTAPHFSILQMDRFGADVRLLMRPDGGCLAQNRK